MSIKGKLIKKKNTKEYGLSIIEGINGSGKTTVLKRKVNRWIKLNNFIWDTYNIRMFKKREHFKLLEKFNNKSIRIGIEYLYILNILEQVNILKFEDFSSGQKKKFFLILLVISRSVFWYIDEPQNYLDDLSYILLKRIMNKHLTISGKIVLSKSSKIEKDNNIINRISLSRFELLTPHLSNECSTTEL